MGFQPSNEAQTLISQFQTSDQIFKEAWANFETKHQKELEMLEALREQRNVDLDEAKRVLREESFNADITQVKFIEIGPFKVQKKESKWFIVEKFKSLLEDMGKYDAALSEGVIAEKIEVDYKTALAWLEKNSLTEKFLSCEDGKELTPAVSGPKPIPSFGAELKEAK